MNVLSCLMLGDDQKVTSKVVKNKVEAADLKVVYKNDFPTNTMLQLKKIISFIFSKFMKQNRIYILKYYKL